MSISKKIKENKLVATAYISLGVAVLSILTTIVKYTNCWGVKETYTLFDFISAKGNAFDSFVSVEYRGPYIMTVDIGVIRFFAFIGVVAVVCAFVGISKISKQTDNKGSFILTLIGLIGTVAPSLLILICVGVFKKYYLGVIGCGIYPIVSPVAMIICIVAATQQHRKNEEYRKKLSEAEGLIRQGEDLM